MSQDKVKVGRPDCVTVVLFVSRPASFPLNRTHTFS